MSEAWYVYILRCADGTLYTGITTDVLRRIEEHNSHDRLAARYTRSRRPVELVYAERSDDRASAGRREAAIKKMSRSAKLALLTQYHAMQQ